MSVFVRGSQPWNAATTMPLTSCVMGFCPSKAGDGAVLHKFPRDKEQRDAWIKFVRAAGRHYWTPAKSSVLCSLHFSMDSYYSTYAAELGIPTQRRLRPGAVPTVYPAAARRLLAQETGATSPKRQCIAGVGGDRDGSCDMPAMDEVSSPLGHRSCAPSPPCGATAGFAHSSFDSQTQCSVQVSVKATQANSYKKMRSIGVQTKGVN
ncbi:THAP domain-containing protein 10-like [Amblyomma americanum]